MKQLARSLMLALVLLFAACSTVTIRPKGTAKAGTDPTWSSSESFFLWGLVGEHRIDVSKVCGNKGVKQMQAQDTFVDSLLTLLTIGIYSPRTAKVWCNG